MRFVAPARGTVDPAVFERPPLAAWRDYADLLEKPEWPTVGQLNGCRSAPSLPRFVAQTPALLADRLHYEQRIAGQGLIATRQGNWHDLLNALIWLRYPAIKQALNQRQMEEIAVMGPKQRSRPQYALTQFDEAGVIVAVRDASLLDLWDAHDWYGLLWRCRQAWLDGCIRVEVFGHALLEHALDPRKLLVGKALVLELGEAAVSIAEVRAACAGHIVAGHVLRDPLELRPLPLSGIPGWRAENADETFHRTTACYQAKRDGRRYPPPCRLSDTKPGTARPGIRQETPDA